MKNTKTMKVKQLRKKISKCTNLTKPMKQFAKQASDSLLEEIIYNSSVQKPYFEMTMQANSHVSKHEICKLFYQAMGKQAEQVYGKNGASCATAFVAIAMENDLSDYFYNHVSFVSLEVKS
jgi:hypothetical protein